MSRYESLQALWNKAEWEGGVSEFLCGYGFSVEDMPDESSDDLRALAAAAVEGAKAIDRFEDALEQLVEAE